MAAGWFHQTLDLIAFGEIYLSVHQQKDSQSRTIPGRRHREVGHEWYQKYGELWDFPNPFPEWLTETIAALKESKGADAAEQKMASYAHDHLDRRWDELTKEQREYWEGRFMWVLYRPDILESWAGVDVIRGRILRRVDGQDVWEDDPETTERYNRLKREVSKHHKWRLREVLARWG